MSYELDSREIVDYIYHRIHYLSSRCQKIIDATISDDYRSLILVNPKGDKAVFKPSFIQNLNKKEKHDKIEIEIEPHKAGVNSHDVSGFLEKLIVNDRIFKIGQPLFSYERQKELPKWKSVLERKNNIEEHKMVCDIININTSTERLRKIIYEYMFRPCLYYLFNLGNFS